MINLFGKPKGPRSAEAGVKRLKNLTTNKVQDEAHETGIEYFNEQHRGPIIAGRGKNPKKGIVEKGKRDLRKEIWENVIPGFGELGKRRR